MSPLTTIDHKMMRDRVSDSIREAIFRGDLKPDERLQEERLATMIGAGRGPVREALLKLEAEGLVVREPYKGARVAMPSRRDIEEIFTIREALESMATKLATPHLTEEDFQQLHRVIELRKQPEFHGKDGEESLNLGFHEVIYQRCPNRHLRTLVQHLWGQFPKSTWRLRPANVLNDRVELGTGEYEAILAALESKDGDAAAALMTKHVIGGRDAIIEIIDHIQARSETRTENGAAG